MEKKFSAMALSYGFPFLDIDGVMPFQIDGRGDMNAFVLTFPLAGVMLLTRRQPFFPSAAHDKFFSICTAFGGYTKFGIAPLFASTTSKLQRL